MTPILNAHLYEHVASVRSKLFELLDEVSEVRQTACESGYGRLATDLSTAAVGMQSVANELGSVEALIASDGSRFQRPGD